MNGPLDDAAGRCAALHIAGDHVTAYAALTTGVSGSAPCTIDPESGRRTLVGAVGGVSVGGLAMAP